MKDMENTRPARRRGIALILASGIVAVLFLASAATLQLGRIVRTAAGARAEAGRSRLVAESGIHYAASRLTDDPGYPLSILAPPTLANRADDWMFRDGVGEPLEGAHNVSYSHGEPWNDDGDGLREAHEAPAIDLDGDGRFSAASGRLRTGDSSATFALKVVSTGALYPVNAPADRWLMRFGDNLGSVLFADGQAPGRFDKPYVASGKTGEAIRVSHLGAHLVGEDWNRSGSLEDPPEEDADGDGFPDTCRPQEGYRNPAEIRKVLVDQGYSGAAADRIVRYMDLGPYDPADPESIPFPFTPATPVVELANAPPEILQALLLYVAHQPDFGDAVNLGLNIDYPRTGGQLMYSNNLTHIMLYPEEAAKVAQWFLAFRSTPSRSSWRAFREALWTAARPDHASFPNPDPLFAGDIAPLAAAPRAAWAWSRAKADAVYAALSPEVSLNPQSGLTWGMEPYPPEPDGMKRLAETIRTDFCLSPRYPVFPVPGFTRSPYRRNDVNEEQCPRHPGTLAPATRFSVESLGSSGHASDSVRATLRTAERLEFTRQESFEADFIGDLPAASLGITVVDVDPSNRNGRRSEVDYDVRDLTVLPYPPAPPVLVIPRSSRGLVSSPGFNPNGVAAGMLGGLQGGALGLTARSNDIQGSRLYFPIEEDDVKTTPESEWYSDPACSPPGFDLADPLLGGSPVSAYSPWAARLTLDGGDDGSQFPSFDFFPLSKNPLADSDGDGNPDEEMRSFSAEFWDYGIRNETVFDLLADACKPAVDETDQQEKDDNDIRLKVVKGADVDPAGQALVTYDVDFTAPGSSKIRQNPPVGMQIPPPLPNKGAYDMHFTVTIPRIDLGGPLPDDDYYVGNQNHVVIAVEIVNRPSPEDANGNGVLDPGEDRQDTNGNGIIDAGEDPNGHNMLDTGEDVDGDCHLDHDETSGGVDVDGDGKLDREEDGVWTAFDSTLYPADGVLQRNIDVIVSFHVNGRLFEAEKAAGNPPVIPAEWRGSWSDSFQTYKSQTRGGWLKTGRRYPSYPYTATKMVPYRKTKNLFCTADDLRFYADISGLPGHGGSAILTEEDVRHRYALGRFFLPGDGVEARTTPTYASPKYVFTKPVRVRSAGWTGTPAGDPLGTERIRMETVFRTYNAVGGLKEELPMSDTTLATDLSGLKKAWGIGYKVRFINTGDDTALYHTPLFEGLWVMIQGGGRTPKWLGWE